MTLVRTGTGLDEDTALALWQAAEADHGRRNGGPRAQRVRAALRRPDALLLVAERDGGAVGVLLAALARDDDGVALEVVLLAVDPAAQRSGVGRALLETLLARYRRVVATVPDDADPAVAGLLRAVGVEVREPAPGPGATP